MGFDLDNHELVLDIGDRLMFTRFRTRIQEKSVRL